MGSRTRSDRHRDKETTPWQRANGEQLQQFLHRIALQVPSMDQLAVVCIGTDRSTGDSFGPWVGTILAELGWPLVIGTLAAPCDAEHYEAMIAGIPENKTIMAIDASLGRPDAVGGFLIAEGPLYPARATGGSLAPIGHYSIAGVVGPHSPRAYWSLQRASLYQIIRMAKQAAAAFCEAWDQEQPRNERCVDRIGSDPAALVRFIR
ncbi:putative sporulation protein YyaC [Paenibacillus phyllosphaerae]|uniref:Putative sporulation protein YyaC n=1 Tax=Paenibacillus phyllosphaerae TaxID=274593 RepID=A0A7W5FKT8_9BACL|nr:spore protease YyaC [Paenibacillus phyllosphaerae]MBB3108520.1 putative sporulation protein YyaC [Paenibacillus phyllosphaerae]